MKYYTSDLWQKMQHNMTKENAEKLWNENDKLYENDFRKTRKYLPKNFLKTFDKEQGFHDFIIEEVIIKSIEKKTIPNTTNVIIRVKNGHNCYNIQLEKISLSKIKILNSPYCICGRISWGYSEFEILQDNKIKLSILCDVENELEFIFEKISIKKHKTACN